MKERVVYNTYYEHFEDFKAAIFGFFSALANAGADSELNKALRSIQTRCFVASASISV